MEETVTRIFIVMHGNGFFGLSVSLLILDAIYKYCDQ